jgi:hypothetical protein
VSSHCGRLVLVLLCSEVLVDGTTLVHVLSYAFLLNQFIDSGWDELHEMAFSGCFYLIM